MNKAEIKKLVRYSAILGVRGYKVGVNELALNDYFTKKFNTNLKRVCEYLVYEANIAYGYNEIIVYFNNKKLDQLASLITYGNTTLPGSNILVYAFKELRE